MNAETVRVHLESWKRHRRNGTMPPKRTMNHIVGIAKAHLRYLDGPSDAEIEAVAEWMKRIFGPDVEFAQHEDPMTDADWLAVARSALTAARQAREEGR